MVLDSYRLILELTPTLPSVLALAKTSMCPTLSSSSSSSPSISPFPSRSLPLRSRMTPSWMDLSLPNLSLPWKILYNLFLPLSDIEVQMNERLRERQEPQRQSGWARAVLAARVSYFRWADKKIWNEWIKVLCYPSFSKALKRYR